MYNDNKPEIEPEYLVRARHSDGRIHKVAKFYSYHEAKSFVLHLANDHGMSAQCWQGNKLWFQFNQKGIKSDWQSHPIDPNETKFT